MFSSELIDIKLSAIKKYLEILDPLLPKVKIGSLEMYAVERLFQLIVDTAIDINTHIISRSNFHTPNDYQGTFAILREQNIIPLDLADTIAKSVGLRNILVHGYEKVDKQKMLSDISKGIGQYTQYMKYIVEFMEKDADVRGK